MALHSAASLTDTEPIFPGVTASVLIGIGAGADSRELTRWMTIGIVALYGIYAFGLALLIELF